jgi:hypothetical protein
VNQLTPRKFFVAHARIGQGRASGTARRYSKPPGKGLAAAALAVLWFTKR